MPRATASTAAMQITTMRMVLLPLLLLIGVVLALSALDDDLLDELPYVDSNSSSEMTQML